MKKKTTHFKVLLSMLILLSGSMLYAQDDCKVLNPKLSGSYSGGCKKGLAHGKGTAVGIDSYEGRFSKGLPNGSGTYRWEDGAVYEGEWSKGERNGKGSMTYLTQSLDSIVAGIWKDDVYVGKVRIPPYKITMSRGVIRSSIRKLNEMGTGFRVGVYLAGNFNNDLEDFTMVCDSGEEYRSGRFVAIQNAILPYSVSIKYRTWNSLHTMQSEVVFEFTINEPGTFEVTLTN
ncbi:MAG: hypothetical protein KAI08_15830 [Bacteroidales bacterium]|nr:hypothetical protein [Bacteroidales bacterium]